jgi:ketosteroid isomerase-like protein
MSKIKNNKGELIAITILTAISAISAFAQTGGEKEILKFIADYDQAYINFDVSFLEANLAEEYTAFNPYGEVKNRTQSIEELRKAKTDSTEKMLSFKTENESVRVVGNTAIATGKWFWSGVSMSNPQSEPHNDTGRYTMIFEKRGGKWMVVTETYSEAPHDKKALEAEVLKMGLMYNDLMVRGDAAAIEKLLTDDYIYTTDDGKVVSKAENVAQIKSRKSKIESIQTTDQKARSVGNNAVVETATVRIKGTKADGKPFEETERYTTVWIWRNLRWQIVSDHTSTITKS